MVKRYTPFLISVLFAFLAALALLHPGVIPTHDGEYHIIRFYEFDKALRDGNLYPRWAADLNNGYGLPLFNFVYPFPNYVASLFHLFGISFIDALKLNMFFALLVGAVFMYLWSRRFWGDLGGIVSSVFYSYSPYHFVDVYIRGSVGEVWALALFPAFLWSAAELIEHHNKKYLVYSSIFLALIIFSHNILALMFFAFSIFYVAFLIFQQKNKKLYAIRDCLYAVFLGLGLSMVFWLPAILEKQYAVGLQIFDPISNFAEAYQLVIPSWGSGIFGSGIADEMSVQIGAANLLVVFISLLLLPYLFARKDKRIAVFSFYLMIFAALFILMQRISYPIWVHVPLINYFQFPWRFLSLTILIASFLAGGVLSIFKKFKPLMSVFLITIVFLLGFVYSYPAHYLYRSDNYYTTRANFIYGTNSPGNTFDTIWAKIEPKIEPKIVVARGKATITKIIIKNNSYTAIIKGVSSSLIRVNTDYFPGWTVYVDGKATGIRITEDGVFDFSLKRGNHFVNIDFENTFIRQIGASVSVLSFILLIGLLIRQFLIKI